MISCVEWIPRGAADPKPKRYEMSPIELEMLERAARGEADAQDDNDVDDEEEEVEEEQGNVPSGTTTSIDPKKDAAEVAALPADLRMDEYSDDDDEEDEGGGASKKEATIGGLLIGNEVGGDLPEEAFERGEEDEGASGGDREGGNEAEEDEDDSDDEEHDSDDDLRDVPDTREYVPTDVEGLEAMGLSSSATGGRRVWDDDFDGKDMDMDDMDDDDDSDREDTNLTPDDALVLVAKADEDFASLEVHVYERTTGNLFVHHDIPLPSYPLCLAHGDIDSEGNAGNYCAVGTFDPGIEIWNLDVLDVLEPTCVLGGIDSSDVADDLTRWNVERAAAATAGGRKTNRKKKRKKRKPSGAGGGGGGGGGLRPGSHADAVMSLSWNEIHRQVLASGSADATVKVWDVTRASSSSSSSGGSGETCCAATFEHHSDKVPSVSWHPTEGTVLATGSFDGTVALVDARSGGGGGTKGGNDDNCRKVRIPADCESIAWDPHNPERLTAAAEDGTVTCWDVRKFVSDEPLWSFVAHEFGGVSDLSYNPRVPGMMATCAIDKTVALWDAGDASSGTTTTTTTPPRLCGSKDMGVGKLYSVSFYPSSPWLLGCGGSGNELSIWDLSGEDALRRRFGDRTKLDEDGGGSATTTPADEDGGGGSGEKDFEAWMSAGDDAAAAERARDGGTTGKTKKKKKGKKKKAHRRGR